MFCYLDLDFNDSRAAYKRAYEFVEHNSIKYGLSTNILQDLGGREKKGVAQHFANDFEWSRSNPGRVRVNPQPASRLVFELNDADSPLAAENFFCLCMGSKGISKESKVPLHYLGTMIHRYSPSLGIIQGGDINKGNGSGGESIFGKKFKDDTKGLKLKHDCRGVLSMGNSGKNSNSSQFFITLKPDGAPVCDKKHVVFGQLIHGFDTLDLMQGLFDNPPEGAEKSADEEAPPFELTITGCGEWNPSVDLVNGFYDSDDVFKERMPEKK